MAALGRECLHSFFGHAKSKGLQRNTLPKRMTGDEVRRAPTACRITSCPVAVTEREVGEGGAVME